MRPVAGIAVACSGTLLGFKHHIWSPQHDRARHAAAGHSGGHEGLVPSSSCAVHFGWHRVRHMLGIPPQGPLVEGAAAAKRGALRHGLSLLPQSRGAPLLLLRLGPAGARLHGQGLSVLPGCGGWGNLRQKCPALQALVVHWLPGKVHVFHTAHARTNLRTGCNGSMLQLTWAVLCGAGIVTRGP